MTLPGSELYNVDDRMVNKYGVVGGVMIVRENQVFGVSQPQSHLNTT
jgi:hypothetical protein